MPSLTRSARVRKPITCQASPNGLDDDFPVAVRPFPKACPARNIFWTKH